MEVQAPAGSDGRAEGRIRGETGQDCVNRMRRERRRRARSADLSQLVRDRSACTPTRRQIRSRAGIPCGLAAARAAGSNDAGGRKPHRARHQGLPGPARRVPDHEWAGGPRLSMRARCPRSQECATSPPGSMRANDGFVICRRQMMPAGGHKPTVVNAGKMPALPGGGHLHRRPEVQPRWIQEHQMDVLRRELP